ncbi:MAG: hypothetical protein K2J65_07695 [Duncaniella sp.]|nr:hypothetical protein [Duncaniella sp.]
MKTRAAKILSSALLLVFVNFMFSNMVFIHYHLHSEGGTVAHSHPYKSSSQHTHSTKELNLISSFNCTATSADTASPAPTLTTPLYYTVIECHCSTATTDESPLSVTLRGPPHC